MRFAVVFSLVLLFGGCSEDATGVTIHASSVASGPFHGVPFSEACRLAGEGDKIVLIDFFTTWCPPCKKLDKTTWKDEKVLAFLNERTIALKIDAEKEVALAARYKIEAYPTIVFLRPDGGEIDRIIGYLDAAAFLSAAVDGLSGMTSIVRAREKVDATGGKNPSERMSLARQLASRGEHEEALRHYLWCWDHGAEAQPSWIGVRGSFLLGEMKALATKYPEARQAMVERRDGVAKKLLAGEGDRRSVMDLGALNKHLGDAEHSLKVFDKLTSRGTETSAMRLELLEHVLDALLAAKRYTDAVATAGDVVELVDRKLKVYELSANMLPDEATKRFLKTNLLRKAARWFEALLGAGHEAIADKLAEHLIRFDGSDATVRRLADHAQRAGKSEVAERLRDRVR